MSSFQIWCLLQVSKKLARGQQRAEKILWNTLKTTFLNVKLQRLCKSHHLQCITSSKDSDKLEISVCKGEGRRPLLDARGLRALRWHCITHRHDSVIDITKWAQEYFQKPLSVNTIRRAICRCQLKLYHAKRKPYVNMVLKRRRVLWAKEEGDLPACYQRSVQKPASLMVWGCISAYSMGSLHVLEGTMNAQRYIKVSEQHMLPSRQRVFQQDNAKTTYCSYYNSMAS